LPLASRVINRLQLVIVMLRKSMGAWVSGAIGNLRLYDLTRQSDVPAVRMAVRGGRREGYR